MIRTVALACMLGWLAMPAAAQSLADLSAYLNTIKGAETRFTQVNADGSTASGKLYIQRPGRMRFEYDPPNEVLVIAGGGNVAIFDDKGDSTPESYPLRRTPLNVLLERRVDLDDSDMVVGEIEGDGLRTVLAQDPKNPEYGTIAMTFTTDPVALKQWVITNEAGDQTLVQLDGLAPKADLSSFLFNIVYERDRRKR